MNTRVYSGLYLRVQVWRKEGWRWWLLGCTPCADPSYVPWSPISNQPTWWNSQLLLLWEQVPIARWAISYGLKYSPSCWRQSVCFFSFCIYSLAHRPGLPATILRDVCQRCSIKTHTWNKWCNCLHRQKCVYSLTGSLVLSLRVAVFVLTYVATHECTEEFSCHTGY